MSSIYEDELNRLIKKEMAQITLLSQKDNSSKQLMTSKNDIEELKNDLKHFQKAMAHFRNKPVVAVSDSSPEK